MDVLGNAAVLFAAVGIFGTGGVWPDVIVATIMAAPAIQRAAMVAKHEFGELW